MEKGIASLLKPGQKSSLGSTFRTAVRGMCPRCCHGKLFSGFLSTNKYCSTCGLDFSFADSGDGPAVFIIMIVGFLVVGGVLIVEMLFQPPYWVHGLLWLPITTILSLFLLRPFKAALVTLQYQNDARLGRIDDSI